MIPSKEVLKSRQVTVSSNGMDLVWPRHISYGVLHVANQELRRRPTYIWLVWSEIWGEIDE